MSEYNSELRRKQYIEYGRAWYLNHYKKDKKRMLAVQKKYNIEHPKRRAEVKRKSRLKTKRLKMEQNQNDIT